MDKESNFIYTTIMFLAIFGAFSIGALGFNWHLHDELTLVQGAYDYVKSEQNRLELELINQSLNKANCDVLLINQTLEFEREFNRLILNYELYN